MAIPTLTELHHSPSLIQAPCGLVHKQTAVPPACGTHLHDLPAPWLHALLQRLGSAARLQLFRTSHGLAQMVTQHASVAHLSLACAPKQLNISRGQRGGTNGACISEHPCGNSCSCGRISCSTACTEDKPPIITSLAALAAELRVTLDGGVPTTYSRLLKHNIRQLTLQHCTITAQMLQCQLQLADCTALHSLVLGDGCESRLSGPQVAALAAQHAAWLPASLQQLQEGTRRRGSSWKCTTDLLRALGPQLTHVRVHHLASLMATLLQLPRLTHVRAQAMGAGHPRQDFSQSSCHWQQLELRGAHVLQLARLPLRGIKQLVLQGGLRCGKLDVDTPGPQLAAWIEQAAAALPPLVCVPTAHTGWPGAQPVFSMCGDGLQRSTQLVSCCSGSIPGAAVLALGSFSQHLDLAAWLPQLPPNIRGLWLDGLAAPRTEAAACTYWQQVVANLPAHVTQLVLSPSISSSTSRACQLLQLVHSIRGLAAALAPQPAHQAAQVKVMLPGPTETATAALHEKEVAWLQQHIGAHPTSLQLAFSSSMAAA